MFSLVFRIRVDNLDIENHKTKVKWNKLDDFEADGRVDFVNSQGEVLFYLPKAYAYDSSGNKIDLKYGFKKSGINLFVSINIPYSWLASAERVYPIKIDPTTALESEASSAASKHENADINFGYEDYISIGSIMIYYLNGRRN